MFKVLGHELGRKWHLGYTTNKEEWLKNNNGWKPEAIEFVEVSPESVKFSNWMASASK